MFIYPLHSYRISYHLFFYFFHLFLWVSEVEEEDLVDLASDNRRDKADAKPPVAVIVHTGVIHFAIRFQILFLF